MRQVDVAIAGTFSLLWLAASLAAFFLLPIVMNGPNPSPDEAEYTRIVANAFGFALLVLAAGYIAATIGLARSEPWGRGMVFVMTTFTMLTVIGIPIAIAQFVALTRPGIDLE